MKTYKNNYKPVTNQRSITVNKTSCNEDNLYAKINIDAMNSAMRDLKCKRQVLFHKFRQLIFHKKRQLTFHTYLIFDTHGLLRGLFFS